MPMTRRQDPDLVTTGQAYPAYQRSTKMLVPFVF
jgi:hypothetical protein